MDASYFLKDRTKFIRFVYQTSEKAFLELQTQIEKGLPPYDNPPYSEDPEPAYLTEWLDAQTGIAVLGQACVSILSDSLKLYLNTLQVRVVGFRFDGDLRKVFKPGFVLAFKAALGEILATDWSDCPANFDVIEQVVLARNRGQHGSNLTSFNVTHDPLTLTKHPRPFFASEGEWKAWQEAGGDPSAYFAPSLEITRETLFAAIAEVEALADYIDGRLDKAWEWRMNARSAKAGA